MKVKLQAWQELRDFTREVLKIEAPMGDLNSRFFDQFRTALENQREEVVTMAAKMIEAWDGVDREAFLEMLTGPRVPA